MNIKVSVEGISPLLMNKFNEEPTSSSKRGKKVYDPKEEAEKKAYRTSNGELYLPAIHFKSSMIKASTDFVMKGKKTYKDYIKSGVFISPEEVVLDEQEYVIHSEPVVIARARVMSWRPKFIKWNCSFVMDVTDEMLGSSVLKEILETAGKYKGVGDHRPEYGRFRVTKWEVI